MDIKSKLQEYWNPTTERCGVVIAGGEVVELRNTSPTPAEEFAMDMSELGELSSKVWATWHTHPRTGPNLSTPDYVAFLGRPRLRHFIIADGDVWEYYVENNRVMLHE